jgi:hypothetical protein
MSWNKFYGKYDPEFDDFVSDIQFEPPDDEIESDNDGDNDDYEQETN